MALACGSMNEAQLEGQIGGFGLRMSGLSCECGKATLARIRMASSRNFVVRLKTEN